MAASKAESSWTQVQQGQKALEEQIQDLKEDKDRLVQANTEVSGTLQAKVAASKAESSWTQVQQGQKAL